MPLEDIASVVATHHKPPSTPSAHHQPVLIYPRPPSSSHIANPTSSYIYPTRDTFHSVPYCTQPPLQIMVYGEYGRTGLYDLQQLLRDLHGAIDRNRPPGRAQMRSAKKIAMARLLLEHLPKTHRLRTDTWRWESLKASLDATGDVGVVDTLLPAVDHAFTVKDVTAMVEKAELELVTFIQPAAYRPET